MSDLDGAALDKLHALQKEHEATHVTIPIAQHEALMAAANELVRWHRDYYDGRCTCPECRKRLDVLAALGAAGIDLEETK